MPDDNWATYSWQPIDGSLSDTTSLSNSPFQPLRGFNMNLGSLVDDNQSSAVDDVQPKEVVHVTNRMNLDTLNQGFFNLHD